VYRLIITVPGSRFGGAGAGVTWAGAKFWTTTQSDGWSSHVFTDEVPSDGYPPAHPGISPTGRARKHTVDLEDGEKGLSSVLFLSEVCRDLHGENPAVTTGDGDTGNNARKVESSVITQKFFA
jgi:hypothetical protein